MAFLTNVSEKRISTSPSAIQVKNRKMTVSIEERLDAISILENVNELLMWYDVRFAYSSVCTVCDIVDRIMESAISGATLFVWRVYRSLIRMYRT